MLRHLGLFGGRKIGRPRFSGNARSPPCGPLREYPAATASADARCGRGPAPCAVQPATRGCARRLRRKSSSNAADGETGTECSAVAATAAAAATAEIRTPDHLCRHAVAGGAAAVAVGGSLWKRQTFSPSSTSSIRNGRSGSTTRSYQQPFGRCAFAVGATDDQAVGGARHRHIEKPAIFVFRLRQRRLRAPRRPAPRRRPCGRPRPRRRRQARGAAAAAARRAASSCRRG